MARLDPASREALQRVAARLGLPAADLATLISYESAGTFSPAIRGGAGRRHIGLIQFGIPEQKKYGAHQGQSFAEQMQAVERYMIDRGFKPGMGIHQAYSTINAGSPGKLGARDARSGGAPGTVQQKVDMQMAGHRRKALAALGETGPMTAVASAVPLPPRRPGETLVAAAPGPTSPLPNVSAPDRGVLSPTPDPFKAIADAAEKRQAEEKAVQAAQLAAQQAAAAQPAPMAPAPQPEPPPPPIDYAGLIMPRIRRGLLADDYSLGLLGAA
jgi:hypothetical protein